MSEILYEDFDDLYGLLILPVTRAEASLRHYDTCALISLLILVSQILPSGAYLGTPGDHLHLSYPH